MSIYDYRITPNNFGVGAENLALVRPYPSPPISVYGGAYLIRGSLAATKASGFVTRPSVPTLPIEGNGLFLQGQMALQALTNLSKKGAP